MIGLAWAIATGSVPGWLQGAPAPAGWSVTPSSATVGDTVWLERRITLPPGWRVRPGRLGSNDDVEALADPVVSRSGADWVVRYAVAAWAPGPHIVALPPIWRLGPGAQADSLLGGTASFVLGSVIPDSVTRPEPRPALAPIRPDARDPRPPLLALLITGATLAGGIWWRRRPPRALPAPAAPAPAAPVPDRRWLEAGESRAVAARAAGRLRLALARLVPEARPALSTPDCLAVVRERRPQAPVTELGAMLGALDEAAFAGTSGVDVAELVRLTDGLVERLER